MAVCLKKMSLAPPHELRSAPDEAWIPARLEKSLTMFLLCSIDPPFCPRGAHSRGVWMWGSTGACGFGLRGSEAREAGPAQE